MSISVTGSSDVTAETELIRRVKDGDRQAFNELMRAYQRRVFNVMYRLSGNPDDAKELTQDVFFKVFRSLKTLKDEAKFKSWIMAITSNTYKNRYNYLKRRGKGRIDSIDTPRETETGAIRVELKDTNPVSDELVHKKRVQEVVQEKIGLLKDTHKEVLILRDIEGAGYEEIADILRISVGTVKSRIFRAREELKGHLESIIDTL